MSKLARMLEVGQQAAARVCAGKRVRILYDTKGGAYTEPNKHGIIHLPPLPADLSDEAINMLRGLVDHESGHVNDTDMGVYKRKKIIGAGIVHFFSNAMEDARVDKLMGEKALGVARNLDFIHNQALYKEDICSNIRDKEGCDDNERALLLLGMRMTRTHRPDDIEYIDSRGEEVSPMYPKFVDMVKEQLERAKSVRSTEEVVNLSMEMTEILKDYISQVEVPNPYGGEGEEGQEGESQSGQGQGSSSEADGDSESSESGGKSSKGGKGKKSKSDKSEDGEGKGEGEQEKDSSGPGEVEEIDMRKDKGDDSSASDCSEEGEDEGAGEGEDESGGGGDDSEETEEAEGTSDSAEGEDGDEAEDSSSDGEGSDSGADDEGEVEDEEEGEEEKDWDEWGEEDYEEDGWDDDGEDEDFDDDEGEEEAEEGDGDGDGSPDGEESEEDGVEEEEKSIEEKRQEVKDKLDETIGGIAQQSSGADGGVTAESVLYDKVSKLIITDKVDSGYRGETVIPYINDDREVDLVAERDPAALGKVYPHTHAADARERGFERYTKNVQELRGDVNVLRRRLLMDLLGNPKKWTKRQKQGTINDRDLFRVAFKEEDLFKQKRRKIELDAAVTLLVDCSGSMSGSKIQTATDVAIILSETLNLVGVPFEVLGFTQVGGGSHHYKEGYTRVSPLLGYVVKPFERKLDHKTKGAMGSLPEVLLYQNLDGESLRWAARRLAERKESKKLLIVICDGAPAGYARYNPDEDLIQVARQIEDSGEINLFCIGVQYSSVGRYYTNHCKVDKVSELVKTAYTKISGFLKGLKSVRKAGM